MVKFLSDDRQSRIAWAKGSEGERRLAAHLLGALGDRALLLHDRKVPGTRGNIDHLAFASSGVWVIDAKSYAGMVEHRDIGGWLRSDLRLYVGGCDRTEIAGRMGWQLDAVRTGLDGSVVPVLRRGVLHLGGMEAVRHADPTPLSVGSWAKMLAEMIAEPGPLNLAEVADIANRLATALHPSPVQRVKGPGFVRFTRAPPAFARRVPRFVVTQQHLRRPDRYRSGNPSARAGYRVIR
ncbi:MAG: NERD domain-containing protein [Actinomycetota bacterium]|nr:NERD domain-containing protein [Actinomycetota bacterium]MDQ6947360.1 NERD domain-containing protein [Actinomycetota bacterium]